MTSLTQYQVVLLPQQEVVAAHCTLQEAQAWQRGYHEAGERGNAKAVIAQMEEPLPQTPQRRPLATPSARSLRRGPSVRPPHSRPLVRTA